MPNLYDHSRVSYRPEPQSADGTPDRCRETSPGYLTRLPWRLSLTHRGRVWGLTQDLTVMHMLPFGQIVKWGQSPTVLVLVQRPDENAASAAVTEWHFTTAQSHEVDRVLYAPSTPEPFVACPSPSFPIRLAVVRGELISLATLVECRLYPEGPSGSTTQVCLRDQRQRTGISHACCRGNSRRRDHTRPTPTEVDFVSLC